MRGFSISGRRPLKRVTEAKAEEEKSKKRLKKVVIAHRTQPVAPSAASTKRSKSGLQASSPVQLSPVKSSRAPVSPAKSASVTGTQSLVSEPEFSKDLLIAQYEELADRYEEALRLRDSLLAEETQLDIAIAGEYRTQDEIIHSLRATPSSPLRSTE
jgi:hypothetical protein